MSLAVSTRAYDNTRAGANTQESTLTPSAIRSRGIKRLFTLPLPGDARGCEAQPLVAPGVLIGNRKYDVVYVATMANQVFAFDANSGARLWMVQLGTAIEAGARIDAYGINDHWGIISTPVIDLQGGQVYVCAWTSPDATPERGQHVLHALRLADGSAAHAPIHFDAVSHHPGRGLGVQHFRSAELEQRAALLLDQGTVFIAFDTRAGSANGARGWLIAVDTTRFQVTATWTSTARGSGGGIGQSGAGPAADAEGNVYVLTGRGDFDGVTDFGDSLVKLRYSSPRSNGIAALAVVDWWTAMNDARGDLDFGSAGPVLVPNKGAVLAVSEGGILYTGNMLHLGRTHIKMRCAANCAHGAEDMPSSYAQLKAPPIFYTYYPAPPGDGYRGAPSAAPAARTHRLHGTPVLWKSAAHGVMHYCWGENGNLRAWALSNGGASSYVGCSAETASAELQASSGGAPGGMISLSASGDTHGVVWASIPYTDAGRGLSAGRFLAYDAANFGKYADGSGALLPLWDSQAWNWRFNHNRFNTPIVWNGRVFMPTYDGEVWVLGLA